MEKISKRILCSFLAVIMSVTLCSPALADSHYAGTARTASNCSMIHADSLSAPTITSTLQDGATIKGSKKNFDVVAKDTDGTTVLKSSNIAVTLNDQAVSSTWSDSTKTSYTLKLNVGTNTVKITATGSNSATATTTYTLYHTAVNQGDDIGKVTFCIEAFTISSGYIIIPQQVEITEGERASQLLDSILKNNGFTYQSTGRLTSGFYLSCIEGLNITNPTLPPILSANSKFTRFGFDTSDYTNTSLGEFDFTSGSGWMYCVNNVFPNYGFSDCYLSDGDVVRAQFTLAYGNDIGGGYALGDGETSNYYPVANKDSLTGLVAQVNSSSNKSQLLTDNAVASAYSSAVSTLENLGAGQSAVDGAYAALNSAIGNYSATVAVTGVSLDKSSLALTVGTSGTLTATVLPANATNKGVTWSSSNTSIATVSGGTVTPNAAGTANITATTADGNYTATCTVTVAAAATPIGGIGGGVSGGTTTTDTTITGTTVTTGGISVSTAKIPSSDTRAATVGNIIVNLGAVTVTAPPTVLSTALGTGDSLTLTQSAATAATQTSVSAAASTNNIIPVTAFNIDLARFSQDGTTESIHNLSGSVTVVIALTDAQIAALGSISCAHIYYYNPGTGKFTDMGATFDLTKKTATFTTTHFSTYVIATSAGVTYNAHVQRINWQQYVSDGAMAGTNGKSLRVEAVHIKLSGNVPSGSSITYQTYVQSFGWQKAVSDGAESGTSGKSKRIEALKITLLGMPGYAVKYRAYVQNKGWMDWQTTKNGTAIASAAMTGTTGKSLRIEAIEVNLEKVNS